MNKPYIMYHPLEEVLADSTHGQCWKGETVRESIDRCRYRFVEPLFRTWLPAGGKILEAGCGLGNWVFYLRDLGYDIVGIELVPEAIQMARDYDAGVPITTANVLQTGFPERHFDAVISLGVVEHFEEGPQAAFRELRRILKDDGLFFVTVPLQNLNRRLLANPLKELKRHLRKLRGVRYAFEEYRYTVSEFSSLLREADFDVVGCFPDDYHPPRSIGLFVDYPFLRHRQNKWELNRFGQSISKAINYVSPWLVSGGALWICRKPAGRT